MNRHDMVQRAPPWTDIPTALLRAELERRQEGSLKPACGSVERGAYDTTAHVAALILILALSTISCGFPLVSRRASKKTGPNNFVFYSQHFGTGVLTATAFVHLLPTAFMSLTDPCLPWIWNKGYRPMAGVIAMTSALIVVGIEMFLRTRGAGHSHSHGQPWEPLSTKDGAHGNEPSGINRAAYEIELNRNYRRGKLGVSHRPMDIALGDFGSSQGLMEDASPLPESAPMANGSSKFHDEDDDRDSDLDLEELDPAAESMNDVENQIITASTTKSPEDERKRLLIQCLLLEAGILFHSIFIGMAVSVSTGTPFVIFLIAISFHQSFEGLALGSRIAAINFSKSSPKPWLMVLAYGTTTPIGQAVGLIVQRWYDPQSETGLLMVGIMNAISSGLLLFAGLVQLLAEDFLTDKSYGVLQGRRRLRAFIAVIGGATLMALVGAWA